MAKYSALQARASMYILENPLASIQEVADATKVSIRTASKARHALVKKGILKPDEIYNATPSDPTSGDPVQLENFETKTTSELLATVESQMGTPLLSMSNEKLAEVMWKIVNDKREQTQVRISAGALWKKLQEDTLGIHALGPGEPLTRADAVERLTALLEACGPDIAVEAFEAAFKLGGKSEEETMDTIAPPRTTDETSTTPGSDSSDQEIET